MVSSRMENPTDKDGIVAASCHLSLHACNRSLFARGLSIDSCDNDISQHAHWPIRTPEWSSCLSDQRRILCTQPRGTIEHERQLVPPLRRLYFTKYIFPPHLSVFGHRAILIWGEQGMAEGFLSENRPISSGHCSNTKWATRFCYENNNGCFFARATSVLWPCLLLGKVAWRSWLYV